MGTLLFETGMGRHPDVDSHYRPRRVGVAEALARAGSGIADIDLVTNCHLHFDHCGGNGLFAGRPVFTQSVELETARTVADYTLAELIDTTAQAVRPGPGGLRPRSLGLATLTE